MPSRKKAIGIGGGGILAFAVLLGFWAALMIGHYTEPEKPKSPEQLRNEAGGHDTQRLADSHLIDSTPEPASLGLLGIGAAGLLLRRRGRRA